MIARSALQRNVLRAFCRCYSGGANQSQGSGLSSGSPPPAQVAAEVPGLSDNVVAPAVEPVGPGVDPKKTGAYKVPEYYCYNNMSYFEAENEMLKYRLPQPSALEK